MCTEQLPPGGYPIAVKYIYIYIYIYLYHIISLLGAHHIIHVSGVGINNRNIYVLFYVLIFSVVGLQY